METADSRKKQEILDAFQFRHATKTFDSARKIPDTDFELIMQAARLSPSSVGLEPWRFLVIQNHGLREKIREVSWGAQGQAMTASHFVVVLARTVRDLHYDAEYVSHMMREVHQIPETVISSMLSGNYKAFQESDFRLLESDRAMFDWACKQTYLALANMMTAAALIGIDSCPIEGFDREKLETVLAEAGVLDREHFGVSVMAAFGYRINEPRPKSRQELNDIWQFVE